MFWMSSSRTSVQAFGLIEVILSMFILTSGLLVVLTPIIQSVSIANRDRDVVVATSLASEAIEIVRNLRDTNYAQSAQGDLSAGFSGLFGSGNQRECLPQYNASDANCSSSISASSTHLKGDANTPYQYSVGTPYRFARKLLVDRISDVRYDVTSMVVWGGDIFPSKPINATNCNPANRCVFVTTSITNWKYW